MDKKFNDMFLFFFNILLKRNYFLFAMLMVVNPVLASMVEEWSSRYSALANSSDSAIALATDSQGNVYVSGKSSNSAGDYDFATIKYDASGNQIWVARYNGPGNGNDNVAALAVDTTGNVYVTGTSNNSINANDYTTIKYDTNGNQVWIAHYNGPGNDDDEAVALTIDSAGNTYVTGRSVGINSAGDYATIKYDANGNQLWATRYNGTANGDDSATALFVDSSNNVYVTGRSTGIGTDYDYVTIKYDSSGNKMWSTRYNGLLNGYDGAIGVKVDSSGNVYVAGSSTIINVGWGVFDYATIKYDSYGNQLWMRYYNHPVGTGTDTAHDMAIDANGNVYVTGSSWGYSSHLDYATVKYDTNGNQQWIAYWLGAGDNDTGTALAIDPTGGVVVTGYSNIYTANGLWNHYATIKYDASNGAQMWSVLYSSPHSRAADVVVDAAGDVYVTGDSSGDYATVKYTETPPNQPPVANAGMDQTVHIGSSVTMDGSGSTDADQNYPLTYQWQITSKPNLSTANLMYPSSINPTFIADVVGDYTIELIVSDSLGALSTPSSIQISTFNTAPVADAGDDIAISVIGETVHLLGGQSYDDDGDNISYAWTIDQKPAGSTAMLDNPSSATPSFVADIHGDYVFSLLVTDEFGASSTPDSVMVSFNNVKPIANAGNNQSVLVAETVTLDGSASSDANQDALTYTWSVAAKPVGSLSTLDNPNSVQTNLVTDLPGIYVASLVVNDGFIDSDPSNMTIVATTLQDAIIQQLNQLVEEINTISLNTFKNNKMRNTLTNKINATLAKIDNGEYQDALDKLQNDILDKSDGCAVNGLPGKNDWITDCDTQNLIYPLIIDSINLLQTKI